MATKKICDICGKEIEGRGYTIKGYNNTLIGSFEIFSMDLCGECFEDVPEKDTMGYGREPAMTIRDLIDRLLAGIQSGELRGSDPVPAGHPRRTMYWIGAA